MIEDSKRKGFQYVLVYQLDRFARNRYDSATYKAKLKKNGVRVLSAKENIADDASGILIEGVLESMAEYYSAELSQKVKRGIAMSAAKCKYFGGVIPLGYKVNSEKNFDEQEELLLNLIFPDYPDGNGENESENESETEQSAKEKEADKSTSNSGCSYTPRLVTRIQSYSNS